MKITYIYHSCFVIETVACTLIIDYFRDTEEGKKNEGVLHNILSKHHDNLYVLSSHSHPDHFNPEIRKWAENRIHTRYIFSKDILATGKAPENATYLDKSDSYKDELLTVKAFGSTDIGISFLIETEGKRIFHAGDLNNWHWNEESTEVEAAKAETNYLAELQLLAKYAPELDVAFFPVDPRLGKDYMRGAQQFTDRIKTKLFIPMHFGDAFEKAAAFKIYAEAKGCRFGKLTKRGQSFEI